MNAFSRIDFNRTLTLYGSEIITNNDAEMVKLSEKMKLPQILRVVTPLSPELNIVLSPDESRALSLFIMSSKWVKDINSTLQSLAEDDAGSLLTGWMLVQRFIEFTSAAGKEDYLKEIVGRIMRQLPVWMSQNIDEVYFDWYEKESETMVSA